MTRSMTRDEKARRIQVLLDELYPETPIPLDHTDPYTLLVAVMLSAQTTDKKVNEVTPGLFALAATAEAMAAVPVEAIQNAIRTVGLAPTKARNLSKLSATIADTHGGVVPQSFEALEALAGVGHKTASVVMSQAFGVPAENLLWVDGIRGKADPDDPRPGDPWRRSRRATHQEL